MTVAQETLVGVLRVLADETRLRILAILGRQELAVGELARCLAMGQSRVSNHLRVLRELGMVGERHAGSYTYCRLNRPDGHLQELWPALQPALRDLPAAEADRRRLDAVLAERGGSRGFFDRIAGDWDLIGRDFMHGTGRLEAVASLVAPDTVVADVGCGTGYLAQALARHVSRVVCIDSSPAMLDRARENLSDAPARIEFREGVLEALPLQDGEVDAACAHMVLHHLPDPRLGLAEMARVVRAGGAVACIDLLPHRESWMHEAMADARLGLDPAEIEADLRAVGLIDVSRRVLDDGYLVEHPSGRKVELPLFLARGRKPGTHPGGPDRPRSESSP